MKLDEALEIFGMSKAEATADAVKTRYKDLMKQVHGDKGGSDFFAKQVNGARDILSDFAAGRYSEEQDNNKQENEPPPNEPEYTQAEKDYWADETVKAWCESKTLRFKIRRKLEPLLQNETVLLFIDHAMRLAIAAVVLGGGYYALKAGISALIAAGT